MKRTAVTSELPIDLVDSRALDSRSQSEVPTEKNPDSQEPRRRSNKLPPPPPEIQEQPNKLGHITKFKKYVNSL